MLALGVGDQERSDALLRPLPRRDRRGARRRRPTRGRRAHAARRRALAAQRSGRRGGDRARRQFGDERPTTAIAISSLGSLLTDTGDFAKAAAAIDACLDAYRRVLGDRHRSTLRAWSTRRSCCATGELDDAFVLARRRQALGEADPDVAQGYDVLAAVHLDRGEFDETDAAFAKGLELARDWFGDVAPEVADILYGRGMLRSRPGEHGEAERLLGELAEAIFREVLAVQAARLSRARPLDRADDRPPRDDAARGGGGPRRRRRSSGRRSRPARRRGTPASSSRTGSSRRSTGSCATPAETSSRTRCARGRRRRLPPASRRDGRIPWRDARPAWPLDVAPSPRRTPA